MTNQREKKYILLISVHGLIRGENLELGRDADTGGQTKYVVDLAKSLAESEQVDQVDLVTRLIDDPNVSEDYAQQIEPLSEKARIVRIKAGPEGYIAKELLWDHLDSLFDNLNEWLNEQGRNPDVIHSHYADAGYVGVLLSNCLNVPLIHTGHSLGRDKRKRLLAKGLSRDELEQAYNLSRRIDSEEQVLAHADLVIASTNNEIEEQYGLYDYYDSSRMFVIPPGTDLSQFYPAETDQIDFKKQIEHFLVEPDKPMILALSRPDERKNILTLISAYGESEQLQQQANLVIVAGTREDISDLDKGARTVFKNILLLMDKYDLYGRLAIPKSHQANEVADIYRMAALSKGVFINPALTEPFGLTLLEAAACGLPIVATENGGPVDIIANCQCGVLIDPLNKQEIAEALLSIIADEVLWKRFSEKGKQGVKQHYSWQTHAKNYLNRIAPIEKKYTDEVDLPPLPKTLRYPDKAICSDLDLGLIGDQAALEQFVRLVREHRKQLSFIVATGRSNDSALALMRQHGIPRPDVLISGLGTRIHYGEQLLEDDAWVDHIDFDWSPRRISKLLDNLPGLTRQDKQQQLVHKISYYYDETKAPNQQEIMSLLYQHEITANVIFSFGQYLDIVPSRASKGQALRYVAQRLEIPLEQMIVSGGSGADEDMMRGNTLAVVVANRHDEELAQLDDLSRIYFSEQAHAAGILDALQHYHFLEDVKKA